MFGLNGGMETNDDGDGSSSWVETKRLYRGYGVVF